MKISSLESMEAIVENNQLLNWNGWDVVELQKSPAAWTKPDGVFKDGEWLIQKRYGLSFDGWEIPNRFVRNHAG